MLEKDVNKVISGIFKDEDFEVDADLVIEDDSLEDDECFMKIEEIVCAFENLGSGGGNRHDFG